MTSALLSVAGALLLWPGPRRSVLRLAAGPRPGWARLPWRRIASPWAAASLAGALAALLSTPLVAVLAAGCAVLGARAVERRRRSAEADGRLLALAEALGVLAAELRAGRPLLAAAEAAGTACPDPGVRSHLLAALRTPVRTEPPGADPDVGRVAAAMELSLRTGCSLAAVATALEDDLRARQRHRLDLRTATAGPLASAAVLAGLPALGLAMGAGVGADPWRVLTTTGPGQVLLVAGVLLEVAGLAWVGRLTRRALPQATVGGAGG